MLSGILMLIEDQYGVGDEIEVLEVKGKVERVGLRCSPSVRSSRRNSLVFHEMAKF
jgi:small-conductance mechanosensitive channel